MELTGISPLSYHTEHREGKNRSEGKEVKGQISKDYSGSGLRVRSCRQGEGEREGGV